MKYLVQWNYRSSLAGPWMKGDVIELAENAAEAVNRDSPGVLKPLKPAKAQNRMVTEGETRDDREGGASDQGPITKEDFKAVKE